jgi:hypothetical protein
LFVLTVLLVTDGEANRLHVHAWTDTKVSPTPSSNGFAFTRLLV